MSINEFTSNSNASFFDSKSLLKNGFIAVCIASSTLSANTNIEEKLLFLDTTSKQQVTNANLNNKITDNEILEQVAIKATIESYSPYPIKNIEMSVIGEDEDIMNVIDVYTEYANKNKDLIFEAEGNILGNLPENYYVRYF